MKTHKIIIYLLLIECLSCKKEFSTIKPINLSDVTVVNAIVNSNALIPDFSNTPVRYFSFATNISNGSYQEYPMQSGTIPISVWQISDTTQTIFKGILNLQPQAIYSLFLSGNNPSSPDSLFTHDELAYHSITDSVAGVRFVNLSAGSNPISVDIQGNVNGSEVVSLPYRQITSFKVYTDTKLIPSSQEYIFEFRDVSTGDLLANFTYNNIARFRNVTIVFFGPPGSQSTFLVDNY
jgi:hypothetical protein